jgi:hypothetical protein
LRPLSEVQKEYTSFKAIRVASSMGYLNTPVEMGGKTWKKKYDSVIRHRLDNLQ